MIRYSSDWHSIYMNQVSHVMFVSWFVSLGFVFRWSQYITLPVVNFDHPSDIHIVWTCIYVVFCRISRPILLNFLSDTFNVKLLQCIFILISHKLHTYFLILLRNNNKNFPDCNFFLYDKHVDPLSREYHTTRSLAFQKGFDKLTQNNIPCSRMLDSGTEAWNVCK